MTLIERILSYFGYIRKNESLLITGTSEAGNYKPAVAPTFSIKGSSSDLTFSSLHSSKLPSNVKRIPLSKSQKDSVLNALSIGSSSAVTGVEAGILRGLYKATVDPSTLMKLSSGGIGSAVMENGRIVGQAGFQSAGASVAGPLVVFQVMSIVTGQYYFNAITKRMDCINTKIEKLIRMTESENRGKLDSVLVMIRIFDKQSSYTWDDIILVRQAQMDIQSLYFNYLEQLKSIADEEAMKQMLKEGFFTSKAVKKSIEEYDNQNFEYIVQMANSCYQILQMLDALYFKMLATSGDTSPAIIYKMSTYLASCSTVEIPEHVLIYNAVTEKVLNYVNVKASESFCHEDSIKDKGSIIKKAFDECRTSMDNSEIDEFKKSISEQFAQKQNIYYEISESGDIEAYIES